MPSTGFRLAPIPRASHPFTSLSLHFDALPHAVARGRLCFIQTRPLGQDDRSRATEEDRDEEGCLAGS